MKSVAIIGAGITGLTAAFYLKRKGVPVTVYEADGRTGGVIRSVRKDGFLAEFGPNTLLETSPKVRELVDDAGLQSHRIDPDPKSDGRYVVRYGRPIKMPSSPSGFLASNLFSFKARLALLREPFVPPRRDGFEESIAQFTVRRFNQEFLDHAIDALVAGIYAGDPYKLSMVHAFPRLKALEDNYGSMIKGQIFGGRERRQRGEVAKDRAPKFSFDEGLQVLPDALAMRLGDSVKLRQNITAIKKTTAGWRVTTSVDKVDFGAVVYCGTAYALAEMLIEGMTLSMFSEIRHPPVASVVLGFRREDVAHPCNGFGMLIPKIEGFKILGTIFSSSLFPDRAPAGHLTLTSYIGGARYPELPSLPEDTLVKLVCEDLRTLLGVRGQPVFQHYAIYPKSIPQYNVGYGHYKQLLTDFESQYPGLYFAGHYRDGISLSDSIVSGRNIVERVVTNFAS